MFSIGIPKHSIIDYETALKVDKFLLVAHGPVADMSACDIFSTWMRKRRWTSIRMRRPRSHWLPEPQFDQSEGPACFARADGRPGIRSPQAAPVAKSIPEEGEFIMQLPHGTVVAVADGERLRLFKNAGNDADLKLAALPDAEVHSENRGSGARHHDSAGNPDNNQIAEDSFASGTVDILNKRVLDGVITHLVIIAAPRTLGELRKHYHKALVAVLKAEIPKELTSHSVHDIEKTLGAH